MHDTKMVETASSTIDVIVPLFAVAMQILTLTDNRKEAIAMFSDL